MKAKSENQIAIADLGLASLLVTLQFQLVGLERANEKRIYFVFKQAEGIEEAIDSYWQDRQIPVRIQSLFNNQKSLKNRLYASK